MNNKCLKRSENKAKILMNLMNVNNFNIKFDLFKIWIKIYYDKNHILLLI